MSKQERFWERAEEMADATRRFAIGVNTGGIGFIAVLSSKHNNSVELNFTVPAIFFVFGLLFTALSLFLAKDKALARARGHPPAETIWQWNPRANAFWDTASLAAWTTGALFLLDEVQPMGFKEVIWNAHVLISSGLILNIVGALLIWRFGISREPYEGSYSLFTKGSPEDLAFTRAVKWSRCGAFLLLTGFSIQLLGQFAPI